MNKIMKPNKLFKFVTCNYKLSLMNLTTTFYKYIKNKKKSRY